MRKEMQEKMQEKNARENAKDALNHQDRYYQVNLFLTYDYI